MISRLKENLMDHRTMTIPFEILLGVVMETQNKKNCNKTKQQINK